MRTALKISLILNLGLLVGLAFTWSNRQEKVSTSALPDGMNVETKARVVAVSAPLVMWQGKAPTFFRWSQLESPDCRTYIKNLRSIGCPEATLRAIVTANVDAMYRNRSEGLKQHPAEFQPAPTQETVVDAASSSQMDTASPSSARSLSPDMASTSEVSHRHDNSPTAAVLPLVFRNIDLSALNLNDQQIQGINDLRQTFVDEVGGLNQNPNDPDYLERWLKAQPEVDSLLQGMLGTMAWETYQVATWNPPSGG
jgi:hypothetical protein